MAFIIKKNPTQQLKYELDVKNLSGKQFHQHVKPKNGSGGLKPSPIAAASTAKA